MEDEVRFRAFKKQDPRFFRRMKNRVEDSNDYRYKHRVLTYAHNLSDEADQWEAWGSKTQLLIGSLLIDVACETTGLFSIRTLRSQGKKTVNVISLTPDAVEEIRRRDEQQELLRPWYLPTVNEPVPWVKPWGGGYGADLPVLQLVKTHNRWYFETLKQTPMPKVYKAMNALQRTPWRVNEDVLCVAEELWGARSPLAGLPVQDALPEPVRPEWLPDPEPGKPARLTREQREKLTEDQRAEFKAWKAQVRNIHAENGRQRSQVVATTKILLVADMYRHFDRFYFPHQLDWRGRAYAVPLFLNPQGNDLARGLLQFAEARPLGQNGAFWLAVHGANCWGEDKVSLDDRVDWVHAHEAEIVDVADDPLSNRWWTEAESPFQFLGFCLEWACYVASGYSAAFESQVVVSLDGSCNGLQHFSAMLRDPVGAEATNLTPAAEPQDVYGRVADRLLMRLNSIDRGGEELVYAKQWLDANLIDRAFVKRQVMTLPYGVTRHGMEAQMVEHCRKLGVNLFDYFEDTFAARRFLVGELWAAIEDVVKSAFTAMGFLQGCARQAASEGLPLVWQSPSGFPVRQHYPAWRTTQVRTTLLGRMVKFTLKDADWTRLDKRRQVDGAAPNFVHSMDAAHMALTVVATEQFVFRPVSWAMVHDSYGTHAGDAESLSRVLREQFVSMYEEDVLAEFHRGVNALVHEPIPDPPTPGPFDLAEVIRADYFFA